MSAEAHAIAQTSANIEKLGTDSNGLLKDAGNITPREFARRKIHQGKTELLLHA